MARRRRRALWVAAAVFVLLASVLAFRRGGPPVAPPSSDRIARDAAAPPAPRAAPLRPLHQQLAVTVVLSTLPPEAVPAPAGSFEGRVVSALTGEGLAGAQLTFSRPEETASVAADAAGAFRYAPRVPGRWSLAAATAPGHQPFAPEWGESPITLEARAGEVIRGITVALSPAETYEGLVVDDDEKPVAGAEVTVLGGGAGGAALVALDNRLRSDEAGKFRVTAPEDAVVEARRDGYVTGRASIDFSARLARRVTIQVRRRVVAAAALAIEGFVEDTSGAPVQGASISASPANGPRDTLAATRSDALGRFTLADLDAGRWAIVASRAGAAPAFAEVAAGATGVRLRLTPGGRLAGRVRDRAGTPVSLFSVVVQSAETRVESFIDGAGRYEVAGITPGEVLVNVVAPGHAPSKQVRVTIDAGTAASVDFELTAGGRLAGAVLDGRTRAPLAGARVEVEGLPATLGIPLRNETVTTEDGSFVLEALAEAPLGVFASAPGHHARIVTVSPIPEGEVRGPLTIELTPVAPGEEPRVELAGIGAVLEKRDDALRILRVVAGGGAAEVGLGAGDEVVSIDGTPVKPMTLADAVPLLRGPEGTTVTLVVIKAGDSQRRNVTVAVPRRLIRG